MKRIFLILIALLTHWLHAQISCTDYTLTSTSTSTSAFSAVTDSSCMFLCAGTTDGIWTGSTCADSITLTMISSSVSSLDLYFGKVNTDDYATITVDGGGMVSITNAHNAVVSGNVVGPFNCGSATYGDVFFTVESTQPFTKVYILNSGCSSGWVLYCPDYVSPPGAKDSTIHVCDGQFDLNDYLEPNYPGGSWTELNSGGQFDAQNGILTTTGLDYNVYNFIYNNAQCGITRETVISVDYGIDSSCVDTTAVDTTQLPSPVNEVDVKAFSPNNDGVNDFLNLNMIDDSLGNLVTIFNRWGDQVFQTEAYDNDLNVWNGNYPNGKQAPPGTYFFIILYDNGESQEGWIQLFR